jgi:hypothetical protein
MSLKVGQLQRGAGGGQTSAPPAAAGGSSGSTNSSDTSGPTPSSSSSGVGVGAQGGFLPPDHVNRLMRCNFAVMRLLGDRMLRPFVQDVMQLGPLTVTMGAMLLRDPLVILQVVRQVRC